MQLEEAGTWVEGYRPSQIRVTLYSATSQIVNGTLYDTSYNTVGSISGTVDGETVLTDTTLSWSALDISLLVCSSGEVYSIRNIEFKA